MSTRLNLLWIVATAALLLGACEDNITIPPERDLYRPPETQPLSCVPNLDDQIDANELQEALDTPVDYLVSPADSERNPDLAGSINDAGRRIWNWSADRAEDQLYQPTATALDAQWYADRFPGGRFVVSFDPGKTLDAVYSRDEAGFYLHGLASVVEDPEAGQTLLAYEEPVALYRFPLKPGDRWVSTGTINNGRLLGLPYAGRDIYEVHVDGAGQLELPRLTFEQTLRVRQNVTLEPVVGESVSRKQVSFLFECFGEIARATSRNNETEEDFTNAIEVRRLGF